MNAPPKIIPDTAAEAFEFAREDYARTDKTESAGQRNPASVPDGEKHSCVPADLPLLHHAKAAP